MQFKKSFLFLSLSVAVLVGVFRIAHSQPHYDTKYIWNKGLASLADVASTIFEDGFSKDDYKNIKEGDIVWVRTGHIPDFIRDVLPHVHVKFVLMTGDGDEGMPFYFQSSHPEVEKLLDDDRIIHWFTQNQDILTPSDKLSPIPIGIDFHSLQYTKIHWEPHKLSPEKQEEILNQTLRMLLPTNQRIPKVFADFHINDSARTGFNKNYERFGEDRTQIKERLEKTDLVTFLPHFIRRRELWLQKGQYAFSISPMGNGLDCHRTWEDLILGCIVIVKTSPVDSLFEGLPVVIVQDWDEVTEENLHKWLIQYGDAFTNREYREKLTTAYWYEKIRKTAAPYRAM